MRKIKFSVLGKGFIGKKHIWFINNNPDAELLKTIDSNSSAEADFNSLNDFIASDKNETDVVCITSPNGLHKDHALTLINAGYHVVIEKPMTINRMDAQQLIDAAKENKKEVFVVMQNRYAPISQWLKKTVDSGKLGRIFLVQINCFWNRDDRYYKRDTWHGSKALDGGTLYTQFSHFVDLLYWCFGDINTIRSRFYDFNHADSTEIEDSGLIGFHFDNGGVGQFNYSTSCFEKNLESMITILAEKGTIKLGGQYMDKLLECNVQGMDFPQIETFNAEFGPYKGNAANHRFVVENVVKTLNGIEKADTSAREGYDVVNMIERMYNSALEGAHLI
ncbi:Gfo/Idh/MocA family oxidoreductase [bacterium]|nr:Gfo/Idh/MocA family oxidoreductase [bacterium]